MIGGYERAMDHENHSIMTMGGAATAPRGHAPHLGSGEVVDVSDPRLYINRELSWLAFNERVLAHAESDTHPLLERVKFLAIAANNLDEFFMIGSPRSPGSTGPVSPAGSPDGLTVEQQLDAARARAGHMLIGIASCWN